MAEAVSKRVEVFDTSLRDGLQQPNLEISVPNAVGLLQRMAAFGVRYAEIGFAGANQFVERPDRGALSSCDTGRDEAGVVRPDARPRAQGCRSGRTCSSWLARKARVPVAVVVVKSRLLDVSGRWRRRRKRTCCMARETIECLQDNGLEVLVDLEHAMDATAAGARTASRATRISHRAAWSTSTR